MKLAITGANSSVGSILLRDIANQEGLSTIACVRSRRAIEGLKQSSDITPALINYDDSESLMTAFHGVDCVVHLAGVLFPGQDDTYEKANVKTTAAAVDAAIKANVKRFVFISVVGAGIHSLNAYWRSKGEAEAYVHSSAISAAVIRTPMLLGPDTAGGKALLTMSSNDVTRLPSGGKYQVRPLDVDDLSSAILKACHLSSDKKETYELVGGESLSHADLVRRMASILSHDIQIKSVPVAALKVLAFISHAIKRAGISPTIIDVITADETVTHNADRDLGITLTPLSETLNKIANGSKEN